MWNQSVKRIINMKLSHQNLCFIMVLLFVLLFSGGLLVFVILEVGKYIKVENEIFIYSEVPSKEDNLRIGK